VAPDIVERHLALVAALDTEMLAAEGFAAVHVLRTSADVESVDVATVHHP
jgi:hypothetical protein